MPASTAPTRTFDDEFSTFVSSPMSGSTGWATELPFWGAEHTLPGNDEAEYYVDGSQPNSPFSVSGGVLSISATTASTSGGNPLGLPYDSGAITTYHSFSQLYGRFEVRAELPAGAGLWPAFWLMPTSFVAAPELDIFEVLGDRPDILYSTVRTQYSTQGTATHFVVPDTSAGFHTYGADWGPTQISFFEDGTVLGTASTPADMSVPMFMILNLAVGGAGSWPGAPNAGTAFPAEMKIDYVRVEQTADTIGWTDPAPSSPQPVMLPAIQAAAPAGTAYGYVFVEHFGNGDAGTPLGGVGVALLNGAGQVVATGVTGANGLYTFGGLAAGTYSVRYIPPGSLSIRAGNFADALTGTTGQFTLADGQGYGVPYQLFTSSAELAGTVELAGQSAANVTVDLLDASRSVVQTATTDVSGHFAFWTKAGQYFVRYAAPDGTALRAGSLADSTTGLTPSIVLADAQTFRLVTEQLTATAATPVQPVSTARPSVSPISSPAIEQSPGISSSAVLPVFRFFDTRDGTQFLTSSATERDSLVATRPDLIDEGVGLNSVDASDPSAAPVFRFFDTGSGTHFYTLDATEKDGLLRARTDLIFEGSTFNEHIVGQPDDEPVFRFFDSINGTHFYTADGSERASILHSRPDLVPEGVAFYMPAPA